MKTAQIFTLVVAMMILGCRAFEPETVVEGEVWDPALNKPAAGISLVIREIPDLWSNRNSSDIQRVYTDAEGKYRFEPFKARYNASYRIDCRSIDDWWFSDPLIAITKETTNYNKTEAVARAKFYFGIINDTPSPDDTLWFKANCLSMNWLAIGAHSDPNKYAKKVGDVQNIAEDGSPVSVPSGWYLFEWEVWRKGNKTYHQDSVWVENGTVYELHY